MRPTYEEDTKWDKHQPQVRVGIHDQAEGSHDSQNHPEYVSWAARINRLLTQLSDSNGGQGNYRSFEHLPSEPHGERNVPLVNLDMMRPVCLVSEMYHQRPVRLTGVWSCQEIGLRMTCWKAPAKSVMPALLPAQTIIYVETNCSSAYSEYHQSTYREHSYSHTETWASVIHQSVLGLPSTSLRPSWILTSVNSHVSSLIETFDL